ncbi:MAG: carboxypeptidase M32, partial [Candidatus Ranarchaeia archaeon]
NFTSSIFSVLHEGGHAIYDQNLNPQWKYLPVGDACSYGIHESQSRFIENIIGKSKAFWDHFFPVLRSLTGKTFSDISLETFVHAINDVHPSPIRIEADEVTYSLHIIIRFELEQLIFTEQVTVDDLPNLWNELYRKYLAIEVEDDSVGILQDTHWAGGSFGYFPSYALGNIYDGQFLTAMNKAIPDWRSSIAKGIFTPVKQWLIDNIQRHSRYYDPLDLIKKATGQDLSPRFYLEYLNNKYASLYNY